MAHKLQTPPTQAPRPQTPRAGGKSATSPLKSQVQQTQGYDKQQALVKPPTSQTNLGIPGHAGTGGTLPDTLQGLPSGKRVAHGTDPGDFYCEHMFFSTQNAAGQAGSSVLRNGQGEAMTGFLHVPGDREATGDLANPYTRKDSRKDTQAVVGAGLRGYVDEALQQVGSGPVRILLTGYGNWGSVVDNPTGAFVSSKRNLDQAMLQGFGAALLTPRGSEVERSAGPEHVYKTWSYRVLVGGQEREIVLRGQVFPVADSTIDGGAASVQQAMADFSPHAVLSMGVAVGHDDFLAEHHADDGGLDADHKRHDGSAPRTDLPDNYALPRAIHQGQAGR